MIVVLFFLFFKFSYADEVPVGGACIYCAEGDGRVQNTANSMIQNACIEPQVGQSHVVSDPMNRIRRTYRLTRTSEKKYVAEIRPMFSDPRDITPTRSLIGSLRAGKNAVETQNFYANKMASCLAVYSPYLKGPNGESLEIKLNYDLKQSDVPVTNISIQPELKSDGGRSRSSIYSYNESIDCPTILHEVLHLLGLHDEYKEKIRGWTIDPNSGETRMEDNKGALAYDCRTIGPSLSVMNNHYSAIRSLFPRKFGNEIVCICSGDKNLCSRQLATGGEGIYSSPKCAKGFEFETNTAVYFEEGNEEEIARLLDLQNSPSSSEEASDEISYTLNPDLTKLKKGKTRNSLLMPAHFRMITNPFCPAKNRTYMECTQEAYTSSPINGDCSPRAERCQSNEDWLD